MERELIIQITSVLLTSSLAAGIIIVLYNSYMKRKKLEEIHSRELREKELELIYAVVRAQEEERALLSRNLHDDVGATLSMSQQKLSQVGNHLESNDKAIREILAVTNIIEQSVSSLRAITNGMQPHYLLNFGLKKSVDRLFEFAQESIGKPCLIVSPLPEHIQLKQEYEVQVYYIVSELLNNLVKHAKPNYIDGIFQHVKNELEFILNHDGVALNQSDYEFLQSKRTGIGLSSIYHRVLQLNGSINFSRNDRGGSVTLKIPYLVPNESSK